MNIEGIQLHYQNYKLHISINNHGVSLDHVDVKHLINALETYYHEHHMGYML